jgi:hypothetical protein
MRSCYFTLTCVSLAAAATTPYDRFISLLKDAGINRPDAKILSAISNSYPLKLGAIGNKEGALALYEHVKSMPQTSTRAILIDRHGIHYLF